MDRTTKVTLIAQVNGYVQGMDTAARKTRETGSEIEKLAQKRQAFQTLGAAGLALGVALAAGLGVAIFKFAQFDQAMSNANAVLQESRDNQLLLRDAALEAGGATVFTATESANAIEELGKAGIGTSDILSGALRGSLDLAASGQLGVARAAEITGITLKQFALDGTEAGRVADVLSAGANKAVGSVEDLANGLKFVAPVAAGMNVSLEDTTATLALFADRGVIGEQAGTSLRGMLSSLTSPSSLAKKELDRLNVSLYDGQGRFKGLENVAGELNRSLNGVSDAERDMSLGMIFGNQQVTAARILVDAGAQTWRDYRDSVDDTGIASRIAAQRMDNLRGDVEKLGGAFDTALIEGGSGANDTLRALVQTATFLVDRVGDLPQPVLDFALAATVAGAAIAVVGGTALLAVPKLAEFKAALGGLGIAGRTASIGIAAATAALSIITLALGAFFQGQAESKARVDSFKDSLDQTTGAITDYTRELIAKRLEERGALKAAEDLGVSTDDLTEALLGNRAAAERVNAKLQEQGILLGRSRVSKELDADQTQILTNALTAVASAQGEVSRELLVGQDSWKRQKAATDAASRATEENERTLAALEGRAYSAGGEIDDLAAKIRGFASATLSTRDAERQLQAAIDDATDSLKDNGGTLDINTEAGRQNEETLDRIARASIELAAARYEETGSQESASAAIAAGRQALIDQLAQFGITGDAADAYADRLGLIPTSVGTVLKLDTAEADAALERILATFRNPQYPILGIEGTYTGYENAAGGMYANGVRAFANGGMASGIYGYRAGGIHKFAEAGPEAYISFLPQYHQRNMGIWQRAGEMLGAWRPTPQAQYAPAGPNGPGAGRPVEINAHGADPQTVAELVFQRVRAELG